jgi:hypothetical protein
MPLRYRRCNPRSGYTAVTGLSVNDDENKAMMKNNGDGDGTGYGYGYGYRYGDGYGTGLNGNGDGDGFSECGDGFNGGGYGNGRGNGRECHYVTVSVICNADPLLSLTYQSVMMRIQP